jgi:hypothetical protein
VLLMPAPGEKGHGTANLLILSEHHKKAGVHEDVQSPPQGILPAGVLPRMYCLRAGFSEDFGTSPIVATIVAVSFAAVYIINV